MPTGVRRGVTATRHGLPGITCVCAEALCTHRDRRISDLQSGSLVAHKIKGLRIATRCTTIDQFVATFHRFCAAETVFISTLNPRAVGLETAFSINLADHKPALRGVGVVLESWATPHNPYGRPGLQLGIRRLTADSEPVFDRLLFAREATAATPTTTSTLMPVVVTKPGMLRPLAKPASPPPATPASAPRDDADTMPPPLVAEAERTPGSELVLPANPLMNISDESLEGFVDCTLYEETGNFFGEQPVVEDPDDPVAAPPLLAPRRTATPPQPSPVISRPSSAEVEIPAIPSLAKPVAAGSTPPPLQPLNLVPPPRAAPDAEPMINKLTPPMGALRNHPAQVTMPVFGKAVTSNRTVSPETRELAHDIAERMQLPLAEPGRATVATPPPLPAAPPPGSTAERPPTDPTIPRSSAPWLSNATAVLLEPDPEPSDVTPLPPPAPPSLDQLDLQPQTNLQSALTSHPAYDEQIHATGGYASDTPPHIANNFPVQTYRAVTRAWQQRRWVIGCTTVAILTIALALVMASHSAPPPKTASASASARRRRRRRRRRSSWPRTPRACAPRRHRSRCPSPRRRR